MRANKQPILPLANIPIPAEIAALPKADIHIHPEVSMRLDQILAKREGRAAYDWRQWATHLMQKYTTAAERLAQFAVIQPAPAEADTIPENTHARLVHLMTEAASDGAILQETRFGGDMASKPDFMDYFDAAQREVQTTYPDFHAVAIPFIFLRRDSDLLDNMVERYVRWAKGGLIYGADFLNMPYDTEADWSVCYEIAAKLHDAGLGITTHVAEIAPANIASALKIPGLTRLGHATHAGYHDDLLELVVKSGVTVEVSLTSNIILGAAPSYEEHPIRRFVDAGVPVALCSDDPIQLCTTIGREYAIAHRLGFTMDELLEFTKNSIRVAFISEEKRTMLMATLQKKQMAGF